MQALGNRHLNVVQPFPPLPPKSLGRRQKSRHSNLFCRATGEAVKPESLMQVALEAARAGAKIVEESAKLPRQIERKEGNDVVTATDKASEAAIIEVIHKAFPGHAIQGEEGGVVGDVSSDYLWSVDPLDGTANFSTDGHTETAAQQPMAACIIEFVGGPSGNGFKKRTFTAKRNGGAFLEGQPLLVSKTRELRDAILATESLYMPEIPESWEPLSELQRAFTASSRGVRISGSAAANACALATGVHQWL
ncbi:hypothetical protein DUNSADRAFT_18320 [Dunaliella salina]|uniref:Inositol-phosphate phosphatase n=1 Tax=Dunaliella salina TaxID=3046 RepID=A0ABQ7GZ83_DUNSA|nr:hypothetical protein DUNSADRAFT_18320 [Dunaliella salina]|eukprot:KAF5839906.1 hypothetical protein DUNSADRAFT_18320 [Dunaliella salina]